MLLPFEQSFWVHVDTPLWRGQAASGTSVPCVSNKHRWTQPPVQLSSLQQALSKSILKCVKMYLSWKYRHLTWSYLASWKQAGHVNRSEGRRSVARVNMSKYARKSSNPWSGPADVIWKSTELQGQGDILHTICPPLLSLSFQNQASGYARKQLF